MMDRIRDKYLKILAANSDKDYQFWADLEGKTTWFTPEQAFDWGLVDVIN